MSRVTSISLALRKSAPGCLAALLSLSLAAAPAWAESDRPVIVRRGAMTLDLTPASRVAAVSGAEAALDVKLRDREAESVAWSATGALENAMGFQSGPETEGQEQNHSLVYTVVSMPVAFVFGYMGLIALMPLSVGAVTIDAARWMTGAYGHAPLGTIANEHEFPAEITLASEETASGFVYFVLPARAAPDDGILNVRLQEPGNASNPGIVLEQRLP